MSEKRYNVIFQGELVGGADLAAVKENIARLFKMDMQKVEALFSGKKVVLRKDADQATAMKLRAAMKQAGARCDMVPVSDEGAAAPSTDTPQTASPPPSAASTANRAVFEARDATAAAPASASQKPAQSSGDLETVGTIRTGGTGFSGPFDVAPAGADMADAKDDSDAVVPDISHLSMAPPGTDLEELPRNQKAVNPDISHLSIANDSQ